MKHKPVLLALTALVLASLACQTLLGSRGKDNTIPIDSGTSPTDVATQDSGSTNDGGGESSASGFPLTDDTLDPQAKIPEFKTCAAQVFPAREDELANPEVEVGRGRY